MSLHVSYHTNSAVIDINFEEEFVGFTEGHPVPIIQVHTHLVLLIWVWNHLLTFIGMLDHPVLIVWLPDKPH